MFMALLPGARPPSSLSGDPNPNLGPIAKAKPYPKPNPKPKPCPNRVHDPRVVSQVTLTLPLILTPTLNLTLTITLTITLTMHMTILPNALPPRGLSCKG